MKSSSRPKSTTAANIDNMMERLGIDGGCCVVPRFNLLFSCALRNCGSCTVREVCAEWLAKDRVDLFAPPKFCPNFDLLSELLCDPAVDYTHSVR
jgi:hypothetical protein